MFRKIIYILILAACSLLAQSFNASVSSTKIGLSDQFQVSFTFQGQDINSIKGFTPPNFSNFMVLSGPNQSTSMQIINGAVSASISFSYYVQPKSMGSFTIGSASISYKGNALKTDPIKIEVTKGSPQANTQNQKQDQSVSDKEIAENLFIRASADKQKAYKGEQVTVVYKLYTRLNIASQMSISKLPQYQGFWAEEIETSNNITFTTEVVNGKQYRVGILKRVALFPTENGQLSVTPFELHVPVLVQKKRKSGSGSIFDDFFNDPFFSRGETVEYDAKSNTIKIDVQPLPGNAPASFSGAVGEFTMNSQLNTTKTKTNEPVSLKVDISGSGNIQLLNVPEINLPSGFEKYEPKTNEEVNRTGRVSGKKSIEYLIVPRTAGEKEIAPLEFSYFNPAKKAYVTLHTPSYTIKVEQGAADSRSYAGKEGIKQLGNDIRFIKMTVSDLDKKNENILNSPGFWIAAIIPLFGAAGLINWKVRNNKLSGNVQLLRYTKAQKIARTKLKKAKQLMEQNKQTDFYAEISQALFGYLEDKLHIPKADFTIDRAVSELQSAKVEQSLTDQFRYCAERTDYIRFAPPADAAADMSDIYNQSANVIIELEKSFHTLRNGSNV
jgi:hypothetical protein